jgi:hypothetical protein
MQDKTGLVHVGAPGPGDAVVFDLTLQLKSDASDTPAFLGSSLTDRRPVDFSIWVGATNKAGLPKSQGAAQHHVERCS